MASLLGQTGELRFTVEVKRKETGKVETFDLVGKITEEQLKELQDGSNALNGGEKRSD
jgi:hypothetical protein